MLTSQPGIGRWIAEYIALRGLGRLEVVPDDDIGARNSLRRRFGLAADAVYGEVVALGEQWWPFAGLVYFQMLLDGPAGAGHLGALRAEAPLTSAAPTP